MRNLDLVLISPKSPYLYSDTVFPRLGIRTVAASAMGAGYAAGIADLALEDPIPPAKLYGITCTTPDFQATVTLMQALKSQRPEALMVVGGPHATVAWEECRQAGFDRVVVGEGEWPIISILRGNPTPVIWGPQMPNLDAIPFAYREPRIAERYNYFLGGRKTAHMMTSRGCPYACAFCVKNWGREVRYRSARNVLDEVSQLQSEGYRGVMFFDDTMLVAWERDQEIFRGLQERGLVYRFLTRANLITEERCQFLAQTGCHEVFLGIESGSQRILDTIDKHNTVQTGEKAILLLKNHGIRVKTGIIIGLPGESYDTIRETEAFLDRTQPDTMDFTVLVVMPGSDIALHPEQYDIEVLDSYAAYKGKPGEYRQSVRTSHLSAEEIMAERDRLHARFLPAFDESRRQLEKAA